MTKHASGCIRRMHRYLWVAKHFWMDRSGGRWISVALALVLSVAGGAYVAWSAATSQPSGPKMALAWWVHVIWVVVSTLIAMALAPKPKPAEAGTPEVPIVDDGQGIPMVFGEAWIGDPIVAGHRAMGTKNIRGKKSGFNGRPIIGYWYKQLFYFVISRGPVDAFLEFRGGDKKAWRGVLTSSARLSIRAKNLWGGEKTGGEGGVEGDLDVRFGGEGQQPSAYLTQHLGPQNAAARGLLTAVFEGGLWGAFSPYPKTAAFKVRRIIEGWEGGCWYPEKAAISIGEMLGDWEPGDDPRPQYGEVEYRWANRSWRSTLDAAIEDAEADGRDPDDFTHLLGWSPDRQQLSKIYGGVADGLESLYLHFNRILPTHSVPYRAELPAGNMGLACGEVINAGISPDSGWWWWALSPGSGLVGLFQFYNSATADTNAPAYARVVNNCPGSTRIYIVEDAIIQVRLKARPAVVAMNPAHILYQSLTDSWLGGEPVGTIDEESFTAAADRLFDERFGLCTTWVAGSESVERFQQRICNAIGASLARSPVDGRWHLDLIRGDYDLDSLPELNDDDIIEYVEQPSSLDDTVNQVIVEWTDPVAKEDRSTAPVQSLGGVQRAGGVVGEVATYREIPYENLALRVAARDVDAKSHPLRKFNLTTTRAPWQFRRGQRFRLRVPKRGIEDMVCLVGEIDRGGLRSGAIKMQVLQDIYGLADSTYVLPEPGAVPPDGDGDLARMVLASWCGELPYALLARLMPPGDLAALGVRDCHLFAVATPRGAEVGFAMHVDAGAGFAEVDDADWCPNALAASPNGRQDVIIDVGELVHADELAIGAVVLWDEEICRLDALDVAGGTVTLARGCADTVPAPHHAGSRLWFLTDAIAVDGTWYPPSSSVAVKLPSRTMTDEMDLARTPAASLVTNQRQGRPYPPGKLRIDSAAAPESVVGSFVVSWAHRHRILQGAALVDHDAGSVGPEDGTTYTVRVFVNGVLVVEQDGLSGEEASVAALPANGAARLEVTSERGGLASWQAATVEFDYRATPALPYADQANIQYVDQNGETYEG